MNKTQSMEHLFKAVKADSARVLQQTVCYDRSNKLTISIAWGYSIQVFEGNELLPDLLSVQKSFTSWRRGAGVVSHCMFNTREYPKDQCKRPVAFFLDSITSDSEGVVRSKYSRYADKGCPRTDEIKNLEHFIVFSRKLKVDIEQVLQRILRFLFGYIKQFPIDSNFSCNLNYKRRCLTNLLIFITDESSTSSMLRH